MGSSLGVPGELAGPSLVKRTAFHWRCAAFFYLVSRIRLIIVYYNQIQLGTSRQVVPLRSPLHGYTVYEQCAIAVAQCSLVRSSE
jgi:hypothetical protein